MSRAPAAFPCDAEGRGENRSDAADEERGASELFSLAEAEFSTVDRGCDGRKRGDSESCEILGALRRPLAGLGSEGRMPVISLEFLLAGEFSPGLEFISGGYRKPGRGDSPLDVAKLGDVRF